MSYNEMMNSYLFIVKTLFLVTLVALISMGQSAYAAPTASFTFSPSAGTYSADQTFQMSVNIKSTDQAVNAFSGTLAFPQSILSVQSISTTGSVANFWTKSPTLSSGKIDFEGVMFNPGYKGSSGKIFTVTFTGTSAGIAKLSLSAGSILANDGLGTNVISTPMPDATYTIGAGSPIATTPVVGSSATAGAPIVMSVTHPDASNWYTNTSPNISWDLPQLVTGVAYSIDQNPLGSPGTSSKGLVSSYQSTALANGVWYAHVRYLSSAGWGSISHYRLAIDTKAPESLTISALHGYADNALHVALSASDEHSGILYYEISVNGTTPVHLEAKDGTTQYDSGALATGEHLLFVRAYDFAGNFISNGAYLHPEPVAVPVITKYSEVLHKGEYVSVEGIASPDATVTLSFSRERELWLARLLFSQRAQKETTEGRVVANSVGTFAYEGKTPWREGIYYIKAKTVLPNGAESIYGDEVSVTVSPSPFMKFLKTIEKILIPIIPILLILIIILVLGAILIKAFRKYRRVTFKEAQDAEQTTKQVFGDLHATVQTEMNTLPKMLPPVKEEKFLAELTSKLDSSENQVENKIAAIEKDITG